MFGIRRREFITLVGGVAAVWSFAAWAQQAANMHKIGFLSPAGPSFYLPAFFDALAELDEGKNVVVEQRYADNRLERLPGLAEELVHLNVDVIVADGSGHSRPSGPPRPFQS